MTRDVDNSDTASDIDHADYSVIDFGAPLSWKAIEGAGRSPVEYRAAPAEWVHIATVADSVEIYSIVRDHFEVSTPTQALTGTKSLLAAIGAYSGVDPDVVAHAAKQANFWSSDHVLSPGGAIPEALGRICYISHTDDPHEPLHSAPTRKPGFQAHLLWMDSDFDPRYAPAAIAEALVLAASQDPAPASRPPLDTRAALRQSRAQEELLDMRRVALVAQAVNDQMSQREIAGELDISQTTVHRLVRRARALESGVIRQDLQRVRMAILQYVAGEISRAAFLFQMSELSPGRPAPGHQDGHVPGEFDEVVNAYMDGLLDEDLYNEILARHREAADQ